MRALSLFSGIGGIDLACDWAGIEAVAFCEREPFCQKVLHKHWPDTPIYDDVCTLTKERLIEDGIIREGARGAIDLILSGDPCQPYSGPGKREGEKDDRFLWPQANRLLQEIRPGWIVRENVIGNVTLGLDEVLSDMENLKYTTQFRLAPSAQTTNEIESLLLATPTASQNHKVIRPLCPSERNGTHGKTLPGSLGERYPHFIGKKTNPQFVEWMMGFPKDFTMIE